MVEKIEVSIIIPTFRRPHVLKTTLESLTLLDYPSEKYEVIVVDDGSKDQTPEIATDFYNKIQNFTYIKQPNKGVATARNYGAKSARGKILIFNDDDIIVPPDLINIHLHHFETFNNCIVNGHWEFPPEMNDYFNKTAFGKFRVATEVWVKQANDKIPISENVFESKTVSACNCGIKKTDFLKLGGYDEQFPYAGAEDHEFALRAERIGLRFIYDYNLKLLHNDHRINIEQFGERQRRNAVTRVLLANKYPEMEANHPMIIENNMIKGGEPLGMISKKIIKKFMSATIQFKCLLAVILFLEKLWDNSFLLPRLYSIACGAYIYRGIQEGVEKYGDPTNKTTD